MHYVFHCITMIHSSLLHYYHSLKPQYTQIQTIYFASFHRTRRCTFWHCNQLKSRLPSFGQRVQCWMCATRSSAQLCEWLPPWEPSSPCLITRLSRTTAVVLPRRKFNVAPCICFTPTCLYRLQSIVGAAAWPVRGWRCYKVIECWANRGYWWGRVNHWKV